MSFLIDTCALSELLEPRPSPRVSEWFDATRPEALFVSVLTLGEIRKGVEKLGGSLRRARIAAWLENAGNAVELAKLLFVKAQVWSYEQEIRLLVDLNRTTRLH